jgi:hypothetical protein
MTCPSCGTTGIVDGGSSFEPRGKLNRVSIFRCTNCQAGLKANKTIASFITRQVTAEVIEPTLWRTMRDEWDQFGNYP